MNNAERQKRYRDKKRNAQADESVTRVTAPSECNVTPRDYHIDPEPCDLTDTICGQCMGSPHVGPCERIGPEVYYHPRTNPERLNWGPRMTRAELDEAGLKANRVPIPGDWDYVGVAA